MEAGSELLATIALGVDDKVGDVLLDMLINPSYIGGTRLATLASTFSLYRFRKLNMRIVSKLPTLALGGIGFALVRDVDADLTEDKLSYVASAETMADIPIHQSTTLRANCTQALNRQRYFDTTMTGEINEAFQFRFLAICTQEFGLLGGPGNLPAMTLQVYMDYDVEFAGEQAPPAGGVTAITSKVGREWSVSSTGFVSEWNEDNTSPPLFGIPGDVYFINPALSEISNVVEGEQNVCRAIYREQNVYVGHQTLAGALVSPRTPTIFGQGTPVKKRLSTNIKFYKVRNVGNAEPLLVSQPVTLSSLAPSGPASSLQTSSNDPGSSAAEQSQLKEIFQRNNAMLSAVHSMVAGLGKLAVADASGAAQVAGGVEQALATGAKAIDST
jgi:hypothetical protein